MIKFPIVVRLSEFICTPMENLQEFYSARVKQFDEQLEEARKRASQIVTLRLLMAAVIITGLVLAFSYGMSIGTLALMVVPTVVFASLVKRHLKAQREVKLLTQLSRINQNELESLNHDHSKNANGEEFQEHQLPNAYDLDLFGNGSLFQHVSRSAIVEGKAELASILTSPETDSGVIVARQNLLKELSQKVDWRQEFQALGNVHKPKKDRGSIASWFQEKFIFIGKESLWKVVLLVSPIVGVSLIVLSSLNIIPSYLAVAYFLGQLALSGKWLKQVNRFHSGLSKKQELLEGFAVLLEHIDGETFQELELQEKKGNSGNAAETIRDLKRKINLLDSRLNPLMGVVLNGLFLWDIRRVLAVEKWQRQYLPQLEGWMAIVSRFDALNSMSNYVFNHPDFCWPVSTDAALIKSTKLAHPLLKPEGRVSNDFRLERDGQVILLSGANMSGKSTFLRTVGLNTVMAQMGLPVCAETFEFYPLPVYTSMRINDSLQDSESYFYSELKRLKYVIDTIKNGGHIMVLLDEILRGTNSNDKHQGSIGLIEQLLELKTSGIIASHDIALASLAEKHPGKVLNRSFEVENENGELVFDYKLREGVCQNLNASYLMKKMGITQ